MKYLFIPMLLVFFSATANATYCSLHNPEYCPPSTGSNVTNNLNANLHVKQDVSSLSQAEANANSNSISHGGSATAISGGSNSNVSGFNGNGTSSSSTNTTVNAGSTFNQVRQTPFAYSPANAVGYNPFKCTDTASLGASAGFGAISGGMPINDESCRFFVKVDYLFRNGFVEEGCELLMTDEELADIFAKTHRECSKINKAVVVPVVNQPVSHSNVPSNDQWSKMDMQRDIMINEVMAKQRRKH